VDAQRVDTVVIGGGQGGLATGYHLTRRGGECLILDAGDRVGHAWRARWDSLRLFTPASFDALPGLRFPAPRGYFPTKDEMADYLERYAARFALPVQLSTRVDGVDRDGDHYRIAAGDRRFESANVVVATGPYTRPHIPPLAAGLDPAITQLHSASYRNPSQLPAGNALVVGAGNSGAEIALELAESRNVVLAGRDTGHIPIALGGLGYRVLRSMRVDRFPGSRIARLLSRGGYPLIRVHPREFRRAGVRRVPRVTGVREGRPMLADGSVLDVAVVVWCTGFKPDYRWIQPSVAGPSGEPRHRRGVVPDEPGLYFVGLPLQSTVTSGLVGGVGVDAEQVVTSLLARAAERGNTTLAAPGSQPGPHDAARPGSAPDSGQTG
jgi:putative flavoprotein involved in K+ transport